MPGGNKAVLVQDLLKILMADREVSRHHIHQDHEGVRPGNALGSGAVVGKGYEH